MPEPATRFHCPVCLGVVMEKVRPSDGLDLELDYCSRCGGMWFDEGEVGALRQLKPPALFTKVVLNPDAYRMKCHRCQASLERNAPACPACGWRNTLECPVCSKPLEPIQGEGLKLDACRTCRGIWFDNVELARLWNVQVSTRAVTVGAGTSPAERQADYFFLGDVVLWGGLPVPPGSGEGLVEGVADAAGDAVEATTDLASGVFEGIAHVLGSALEGLTGIDF